MGRRGGIKLHSWLHAYKVREKDPTLGDITNKVPNLNNWVAKMSNSSLTEPSEKWKEIVKQFEIEF